VHHRQDPSWPYVQLYVIVHQAVFVYNDGPTGMNELLKAFDKQTEGLKH